MDPPARVIRQSARVAIRVWTGHPVCIVAGRGGVAFWPDSDVALQILPESAQALMRHPLVRILAVTGGPGVVKEAMNSGKRAIAAGPGNPPAVVDDNAHLEIAANGASAAARLDLGRGALVRIVLRA